MNFRDLGGLATGQGVVASGLVFRTAQLSAIDDAAAEYLATRLRIGRYIDFRGSDEIARDGEPTALVRHGIRWVRHPFDISDDVFLRVHRPGPGDWEGLYARAVRRLKPEFQGALELIAAEETPVIFGCWVGKDRTGLVAALFLSLLGVSPDDVVADYVKTTEGLLEFKKRFAFLWEQRPQEADEIFASFGVASADVMHGFLRSLTAEFGTVDAALSLSPGLVETLRRRYIAYPSDSGTVSDI